MKNVSNLLLLQFQLAISCRKLHQVFLAFSQKPEQNGRIREMIRTFDRILETWPNVDLAPNTSHLHRRQQ